MKPNKNYEVKNPNAPMSDPQSYRLYLMTGVDVRETELTKGEASAHIDAIVKGKCYHTRVALAELEDAVIKRQDVHKSNRKHSKPRGYATAMEFLMGEVEAPEPEPKPKAKTPAKPKKKTTPKKPESEYAGLVEAMANADPERLALVKALFSA